jgi:hypothetical protein
MRNSALPGWRITTSWTAQMTSTSGPPRATDRFLMTPPTA